MNSIKKILWYRLYFTRLIFSLATVGKQFIIAPDPGTPDGQLLGFQKGRCRDHSKLVHWPSPTGELLSSSAWDLELQGVAFPPPPPLLREPLQGPNLSRRRWAQFSLLSHSPLPDLSAAADVTKSAKCRQLSLGLKVLCVMMEWPLLWVRDNKHGFLQSHGSIVPSGEVRSSSHGVILWELGSLTLILCAHGYCIHFQVLRLLPDAVSIFVSSPATVPNLGTVLRPCSDAGVWREWSC